MRYFQSSRVGDFLYQLGASYWFIPAMMSFGGAMLAALLVVAPIDSTSPLMQVLAMVSTEQAVAVLSTLASSVISVVGTIFSITLVALVLASQQYGPRIVEGFMRDRGTQIVIGAFMATFVYLVIALVMLNNASTLRVALLAALALVLIDILLLIYYIHHVVIAIRSETILRLAVRDIDLLTDMLYPRDIGQNPPADFTPPNFAQTNGIVLRASMSGYFQNVYPEIITYAHAHDLVLRIESHPGAFVLHGEPLITVLSGTVTESMHATLLHFIDIGGARTVEQDVKFLFDKLTETAVRALSPAVNDPVTALMCLDRIADGLLALNTCQHDSLYRFDNEGALRLIVTRPVTTSWMIEETFNPIRRYGRSDLSIMVHIVTLVGRLAEQIREEEAHRELHHQAYLVMQQTRTHRDFLPEELQLLEKRYAQASMQFDPSLIN